MASLTLHLSKFVCFETDKKNVLYYVKFCYVKFAIKKKNVLCKIHIPNLAKDFQSETNMPSIKVRQCCDIYPKLSVLKWCGNFCCFSTFLTTPNEQVHHCLSMSGGILCQQRAHSWASRQAQSLGKSLHHPRGLHSVRK